MIFPEWTVKTRCFVLGHDLSAPRKVRHHARKRQKCKRCGIEVMTLIPFVEQDAEQQALSLRAQSPADMDSELGGSTYKPSPAELADHLDPPWAKPPARPPARTEGSDNDIHKP